MRTNHLAGIASEDYPELSEILVERPPLEGVMAATDEPRSRFWEYLGSKTAGASDLSAQYMRTGRPTQEDFDKLIERYRIMHGHDAPPAEVEKLRKKIAVGTTGETDLEGVETQDDEGLFAEGARLFAAFDDDHPRGKGGKFVRKDGSEIPVAKSTDWKELQKEMGAKWGRSEDMYPERYEPNKGSGYHLKPGEKETRRGRTPDNRAVEYDVTQAPDGMNIDQLEQAGYEFRGLGMNAMRPLVKVPGSERPLSHVYRTMSEGEWQDALKNGYIKSDGRMNLTDNEGTCTSQDMSTFYAVPGKNRIVRIKHDPSKGWWQDTADTYIKNPNPIDLATVEMVSPAINMDEGNRKITFEAGAPRLRKKIAIAWQAWWVRPDGTTEEVYGEHQTVPEHKAQGWLRIRIMKDALGAEWSRDLTSAQKDWLHTFLQNHYTVCAYGTKNNQASKTWDQSADKQYSLLVNLDKGKTEWGKPVTAAWATVQAKAVRIYRDGGVRVIAADAEHVAAHVQGDNGNYLSELDFVPGSKSPSMWTCSCPWSAYSWGRSGRWKKYEGRMCLVPETMVTMADGTFKRIDEVQVGDLVLTHDGIGAIEQVIISDYKGSLQVIQSAGYAAPLSITPNHEVWGYSTPQRLHKSWQDAKGQGFKFYDESFLLDNDPAWIDSGEIRRHDWLTGAILPTSQSYYFDLSQALDNAGIEYEVEGERIWTTTHIRGRHANSLPVHLLPTRALMTVLGIYLAEGNFDARHKEVQWTTIHQDEEAILGKMLQAALTELNAGTLRVYRRPDFTKGISLRLTNRPLAYLLHTLAGTGSRSKALHPWVMTLPPDAQEAMLEAYWLGDGSTSGTRRKFTTTSDHLAQQVHAILLRCGHLPSWSRRKNNQGPANRDGFAFINSVAYVPERQFTNGQRANGDGFYSTKVSSVETVEYEGEVYNLKVSTQESYVANGRIVHNCSHATALYYQFQSDPSERKVGPDWDNKELTMYEAPPPGEWRVASTGTHYDATVASITKGSKVFYHGTTMDAARSIYSSGEFHAAPIAEAGGSLTTKWEFAQDWAILPGSGPHLGDRVENPAVVRFTIPDDQVDAWVRPFGPDGIYGWKQSAGIPKEWMTILDTNKKPVKTAALARTGVTVWRSVADQAAVERTKKCIYSRQNDRMIYTYGDGIYTTTSRIAAESFHDGYLMKGHVVGRFYDYTSTDEDIYSVDLAMEHGYDGIKGEFGVYVYGKPGAVVWDEVIPMGKTSSKTAAAWQGWWVHEDGSSVKVPTTHERIEEHLPRGEIRVRFAYTSLNMQWVHALTKPQLDWIYKFLKNHYVTSAFMSKSMPGETGPSGKINSDDPERQYRQIKNFDQTGRTSKLETIATAMAFEPDAIPRHHVAFDEDGMAVTTDVIPLYSTANPLPGEELARQYAMAPNITEFMGEEMTVLSEEYRDLPVLDRRAVGLWEQLGAIVNDQAAKLRQAWTIQVVDYDPYETSAEMFADMDQHVYKVCTLHSHHPVWDTDTNVNFRIAHDIQGHFAARSDFSFYGEVQAYRAQCETIPESLWTVLFTEVVAQSAYANVHHLFGEQKVGLVSFTPAQIQGFVGQVIDAPTPEYDALHFSACLVCPNCKGDTTYTVGDDYYGCEDCGHHWEDMSATASLGDQPRDDKGRWVQMGKDLEADHPGSEVWVDHHGSHVSVSKVRVPKELRNNGHGNAIMKKIIDQADREGIPVTLTPTTGLGGSKPRLIRWYRSLGFVPNKGKLMESTDSFVRFPKTSSKQASTPANIKDAVHLYTTIKVNNQKSNSTPEHDGFRYAYHKIMGDPDAYRHTASSDPGFIAGEQKALTFLRAFEDNSRLTNHPLYRAIGLSAEAWRATLDKLETGTIDLPPSSWTSSRAQTDQFAQTYGAPGQEHAYEHRILFQILPGADSWALGRTSMTSSEREHVTGGRYQVLAIDFPRTDNTSVVKLMQTESWTHEHAVDVELFDRMVFTAVVKMADDGVWDKEKRDATGKWTKTKTENAPTHVTKRYHKQVADRIADAPKPTAEDFERFHRSHTNNSRAGGELRGSSRDRHARTMKLLREFGDGEHCKCAYCGKQLDRSTVTQDKIYPECGYRYSNILPACINCNQHRSNKPVTFAFAASIHSDHTASIRTAAKKTEPLQHILNNFQFADGPNWNAVLDNYEFSAPTLQKMQATIKANGINVPIPIDYSQSPPKVVDGHTRLAMAQRVGMTRVPVDSVDEFMYNMDKNYGPEATLNDEPEAALPTTDGTTDTPMETDNLLPACIECNQHRSNKPVEFAFAASVHVGVGIASIHEGAYYHGTNADLHAGDVLETGMPTSHAENDKVWVADNAWIASNYGYRVYEVEPASDPQKRGKAHEFYTEGATILGEVSNERIRQDSNDYAKHGTLNDEPEAALPTTDGTTDTPMETDNESPVDSADDIGQGTMASRQWLMDGKSKVGDADIAKAARIYLEAHKTFTVAEQKELINEGEHTVARNFHDLDLSNTHYESLEGALQEAESSGESIFWATI
jgi:GNAT superfamily N-acetyltransferase